MRFSMEGFAGLENENRQERTAERPVQKNRIVVMLGARLFQEGMGNGLPPRFPLVNESVKEGMPKEVSGGDSRMRAIQQLYEEFLEKKENGSSAENFHVFTTGGEEKIKLGESEEVLFLSRANEARKKLIAKYDLPKEIMAEAVSSSGSTIGNAAAVSHWIKNHHDINIANDVKEVEIVTNEFHMMRAWIMFSMAFYKNEFGKDIEISQEDILAIEKILDETLSDENNGDKTELTEIQKIFEKYLKDVAIHVKPVIAEEVVARKGLAGLEYAEKIKENEFVKQARSSERNGIKDLIHGRYKVK